jgi:hypothetical protein
MSQFSVEKKELAYRFLLDTVHTRVVLLMINPLVPEFSFKF